MFALAIHHKVVGAPPFGDAARIVRHGGRAPASRPRGVTLLELLLVLILLVLIGGMAWPLLDRPLAGSRLRRSAELVRAAWSTARNRAMLEGEVYAFRCYPETGRYEIAPLASNDALAAGVAAPRTTTIADDDDVEAAHPLALPRDGRLASGVRFAAGEVDASAAAMSRLGAAAWNASTAALGDASGALVLFYPDGAADSTQVTLVDEKTSAQITVELRGLTGTAKVGEVSTDNARR